MRSVTVLFFRDELLPLLHLSWQPLKLLLRSPVDGGGSGLLLLERAFRVVLVFSRCAGDFVRGRVVKEALPAMLDCSLCLQRVLSDRGLLHTTARRRARRLLGQLAEALAELPATLGLDEAEVDEVLEGVLALERFWAGRPGADRADSVAANFVPKRKLDADSWWLKRHYCSSSLAEGSESNPESAKA